MLLWTHVFSSVLKAICWTKNLKNSLEEAVWKPVRKSLENVVRECSPFYMFPANWSYRHLCPSPVNSTWLTVTGFTQVVSWYIYSKSSEVLVFWMLDLTSVIIWLVVIAYFAAYSSYYSSPFCPSLPNPRIPGCWQWCHPALQLWGRHSSTNLPLGEVRQYLQATSNSHSGYVGEHFLTHLISYYGKFWF